MLWPDFDGAGGARGDDGGDGGVADALGEVDGAGFFGEDAHGANFRLDGAGGELGKVQGLTCDLLCRAHANLRDRARNNHSIAPLPRSGGTRLVVPAARCGTFGGSSF